MEIILNDYAFKDFGDVDICGDCFILTVNFNNDYDPREIMDYLRYIKDREVFNAKFFTNDDNTLIKNDYTLQKRLDWEITSPVDANSEVKYQFAVLADNSTPVKQSTKTYNDALDDIAAIVSAAAKAEPTTARMAVLILEEIEHLKKEH